MNKRIIVGILFATILMVGCANQQSDPTIPDTWLQSNHVFISSSSPAQTHLWGYYDIYIDIPSKKVEAVANRNAMFSANVVTFVNNPPSNLEFLIHDTPVDPGGKFVDVDIDVTINHPFPGMTQYNGYDVRGIFIGNGSKHMEFNTDLIYARYGSTDQVMYDYNLTANDPYSGLVGMPDGYTRWWNPSEFLSPGIFGYTGGKLATKGYLGNATINPYKYFADGLTVTGDLWEFLTTTTNNAVFSAGAKNKRNYYLRFPLPNPGVKFNYAILANWKGTAPEDHPANASEAVGLSVTITPDIYFTSPSDRGGDLILDVSVFDWDSKLSAGVMEDYKLIIESTVLDFPYYATSSDMTPTGAGENYFTYHLEIAADNVVGTQNNELWIIVENQNLDYTNTYNVPNSADKDKLVAMFRYDLYVSPVAYNKPPICDLKVVTPMPVVGWSPQNVVFDATGTKDPDSGDVLTYNWDFDGDEIYGENPDDLYSGPSNYPTYSYSSHYSGKVNLKVTDLKGEYDICSVAVNVTAHKSKNIPLRSGVTPRDLGVDHGDGDLLILYSDGQVWRYLASAYYQTGSHFYTVPTTAEFIDVNLNGDSIVAGNRTGTSPYGRSFSSTGTGLTTLSSSYCTVVTDVAAITTNVGYSGWHVVISSAQPLGYANSIVYSRYTPPNYVLGMNSIHSNSWGIGNLHQNGMQAFEYSNSSMDRMWHLETAPERRVEAYTTSLTYAGFYIGGSASDGMSGFNNPLDITRDNNNNVYVLDLISTGIPRVKKYTANLLSVGFFGNATTISGTPLRIDGSDFNGNIFVLHTNGLSIFFPSEIP